MRTAPVRLQPSSVAFSPLVRPVNPTPTPRAGELNDNFDDNSRDTAFWQQTLWDEGNALNTGSIAETNQRVEIAPPINTAGFSGSGYLSAEAWDFSGDGRAYVKITASDSFANDATGGTLFVGEGPDKYVSIVVGSSSVVNGRKRQGSNTDTASTTYNATSHGWFSVRYQKSDDTWHFEVAPAAVDPPTASDWTDIGSLSNAGFLNPAALRQGFGTYNWKSTPNAVTHYYDAYNTATTTASGTSAAITGQDLAVAQGATASTTTVALTGQALTAAQGNVLQGAPLVGQNTTVAQSSAAPVTSIALTGQALTAARGTVAPTISPALTGQPTAAAQGSVLQGAPITGQSTAVAQGTAAPVISVALTGQSVAAAAGTVTAASSFALSGQALTAARGSVTAAPSLTLSGQSVTVAQGSAAASTSIGLTGQSAVVGEGTVTVAGSGATTAALTGQGLTAASGTATPTISIALTGQSLGASQGTITPSASRALTGASIASTQGTTGVSFGSAITGQSVTVSPGSITLDVSASLAGQPLLVDSGALLTRPAEQYPLAGIPQPYPGTAATYPLTTAQTYPQTQAQTYPLEGKAQQYPLAS